VGEVPWLVIGGVAVVIVAIGLVNWYAMQRRRIRERRAVEEAARALAEHHRPRWNADPATFRPQPRDWSLAVAAPFALCSEMPWDDIRYSDASTMDQVLRDAWGIGSRAQLLSSLAWVYTEGHRAVFQPELRVWSALPAGEAGRLERALTRSASGSRDAAEELWRFHRARADDRRIREVDFLAWDLVRFGMLTRAGVTLGYLTEEEGWDALAMLTDDLHGAYRGWEDLGEQFRLARWYWHGVGGEDEAETDAHDRSRQAALLGPDGPWRAVPWRMPVPAARGLLADALVDEALVVPMDADDLRAATPQAVRLDALVRARYADRA
jgi:hypothetical protein